MCKGNGNSGFTLLNELAKENCTVGWNNSVVGWL